MSRLIDLGKRYGPFFNLEIRKRHYPCRCRRASRTCHGLWDRCLLRSANDDRGGGAGEWGWSLGHENCRRNSDVGEFHFVVWTNKSGPNIGRSYFLRGWWNNSTTGKSCGDHKRMAGIGVG